MKISLAGNERYEFLGFCLLAPAVLATGEMKFITKTTASFFSVILFAITFKAGAAAVQVHTSGSVFDPSEVTISAGQTVEWLNNDATEHTVTSYPDASFTFDSAEVEPGDSYFLTFDAPGDYPYYCVIHGFGMSGVVHVQAAAANNPPATPVNVSPVNNATGQPTTVTMNASVFSDSDSDTHAASEWVVRSNSVVVVDSGETAVSLTNYSPAGLAEGTGYDWQVRYKDSRGAWSEYSTATHFTTIVTAPKPPAQLFASGFTNGVWKLTGTGAVSAHFTVLATTNFVQWTNIGTATSDVSGAFMFTDSNAVLYKSRFYRTTNN